MDLAATLKVGSAAVGGAESSKQVIEQRTCKNIRGKKHL